MSSYNYDRSSVDKERGAVIGLGVALAVVLAGVLILGIMAAVSASIFTKSQVRTRLNSTSDTVPWVKIGQNLTSETLKRKQEYSVQKNLFDFSPKFNDTPTAPNTSNWQIVPDVLSVNGTTVHSLYFVNLSSNQQRPNVMSKMVMAYDGNFGSVCGNPGGGNGWQQSYNAALNLPYVTACPQATSSSQCNCPAGQACSQCPTGQVCTAGMCQSGGGFAGNYVQIGSWVIFPEQVPIPGTTQFLDVLSFATNAGQRAKFQMSDVGNFVGLCNNNNVFGGFNIINNAQGSGGFGDPPCGAFQSTDGQYCYQGFGQTCPPVGQATCNTGDPAPQVGAVCVQGNWMQLDAENLTTDKLNIGGWQIYEVSGASGPGSSELRFVNPNGQYFAMQDTGQFVSSCAGGKAMGSLTWQTLYSSYGPTGNPPTGQVPWIDFEC